MDGLDAVHSGVLACRAADSGWPDQGKDRVTELPESARALRTRRRPAGDRAQVELEFTEPRFARRMGDRTSGGPFATLDQAKHEAERWAGAMARKYAQFAPASR